MEVVNKNVIPKNNILNYLKSLNVSSSNKHEEREIKDYFLSVVMITTTLNSDNEHTVYLVCQDKKNNSIYGNLLINTFTDDQDAINYYNELKSKMNSFKDADVKALLPS